MRTIDERIEKLGYKKVCDHPLYVSYAKHEEIGNFTHVVALCHKASGKHIIQSYDEDDSRMCGLTYTESVLFAKKIKELWGKS